MCLEKQMCLGVGTVERVRVHFQRETGSEVTEMCNKWVNYSVMVINSNSILHNSELRENT